MEIAIATFGGILLLFSLGGGILAKCSCLRADDQSHKVDRIGAVVLLYSLYLALSRQ